MSDIVGLLLEADNDKSDNFSAAQAELVEKCENEPIDIIIELLNRLWDESNSERLMFLMITLITNSFKRTIIITVPKYAVCTSTVEPDLAQNLFQAALSFFSHSYEPLRAAAANLFMVVASAEMQMFPELSLIDQLTERLGSDNTAEVLSATECFTVILRKFVIEETARSQIFQAIFQLVESIECNTKTFTDSTSVLHHVIAMLVNISSSIFEELDTNESCAFMNHVVSHLVDQPLKEVVYQFIGSVAQENFTSILEFIPQVFQESVTDILSDTETQRNKLAATYLWEQVFSIEHVNEEVFNALSEVADNIIPVLIQEMTQDTLDEPSETNWDPSDAAFSALLRISDRYLQTFLQYVNGRFESDQDDNETGTRIANIRCLLILSHYLPQVPDYYSNLLTRVCGYLQDECVNVIYFALHSLSNIIVHSATSNDFVELFPTLFEMSLNDILGIPALNCIYHIVHHVDFSYYAILSSLESLFESISINNVYLLTKCFDFVYQESIPVDIALDVLNFLINLMKQCDEAFASIVCRMFPPLCNKCGDLPSQTYMDAFSILTLWMDNDMFYAMPAVCSMAYINPQFIAQSLTTIVPYVLENLNSGDLDRSIQAINAWSIIYICIDDLEDYSDQLFEAIIDKADPQAPLSQQTAVIHAFYVVSKHIKNNDDLSRILIALERYRAFEVFADLEMLDVDSFQTFIVAFLDLMYQIAMLGGISIVTTFVNNIVMLKTPAKAARNQLMKLAKIFMTCDHNSFPNASILGKKICMAYNVIFLCN
ncbi:hypothetical protein TVAG_372940 [Trichomonas vaginalis G3]|uniref:Importin N-terminal domain-containing protein n=1 Tax=Trichomonas vaginalis (strain ATCC PRA-98 / G3) TaxID=412133 RepID=A2DZF7_TRIV3|nr:armadillo (ARM) repeat-containing protein family [Trichomonas vaginalis G3]EAY14161.1 hypothetical protein TVAG_372940 [Trichomonas vaginalis G3]KAI5540702.1 armadillo (ARM) repeat-containing protein family [Trichomonas vaginalis G3]|eukprot:XP_001326384.1 hypothetical protein [Trichomonas vaginalis G3]